MRASFQLTSLLRVNSDSSCEAGQADFRDLITNSSMCSLSGVHVISS